MWPGDKLALGRPVQVGALAWAWFWGRRLFTLTGDAIGVLVAGLFLTAFGAGQCLSILYGRNSATEGNHEDDG